MGRGSQDYFQLLLKVVLVLLSMIYSTHEFYMDDGATDTVTWDSIVKKTIVDSPSSTTSNYIPPIAIDVTSNSLYIGTVDAVMKFTDITSNFESDVIKTWSVETDDCDGDPCENIIMTVLLMEDDTQLLACGTFDAGQACAYYNITLTELVDSEIASTPVTFMTPANANGPVVAFATDESLIFTGVYFMNTSPTIARLSYMDTALVKEISVFTTNNARVLNDVDFVHAMDYQNTSVLYFFREHCYELEEYADEDVYSRVGRVCKYDEGVSEDGDDPEWSTFLKARLICSIPGDTDFNFNYLYGVYELGDYLYGVFTTPENSYQLSAVCKYNLEDLNSVLDTGKFLFHESCTTEINNDVYTVWNELPEDEVLDPRPGMCTQTYTDDEKEESADFLSDKTLVADDVVVSDSDGNPTLVLALERFTQIIVDQKTVDGCTYNVMFIGTEDGGLLRVVEVNDDCYVSKTFVIGSTKINVTGDGEPVTSMKLLDNYLFITSHDDLYRIPTSLCSEYSSCTKCIEARDPYCGWLSGDCVDIDSDGSPVQDIANGDASNKCGSTASTTSPTSTPDEEVCDDYVVTYKEYLVEIASYFTAKKDCCDGDNTLDYCSDSKK